MKKKPDLKLGDKFGWDHVFTGEPVWITFEFWDGDHAVDLHTAKWHWKFIKRIRRKKQKPEVKSPVTFECKWLNAGHPVGLGVGPILQSFVGKKTKVTIEVIE